MQDAIQSCNYIIIGCFNYTIRYICLVFTIVIIQLSKKPEASCFQFTDSSSQSWVPQLYGCSGGGGLVLLDEFESPNVYLWNLAGIT